MFLLWFYGVCLMKQLQNVVPLKICLWIFIGTEVFTAHSKTWKTISYFLKLSLFSSSCSFPPVAACYTTLCIYKYTTKEPGLISSFRDPVWNVIVFITLHCINVTFFTLLFLFSSYINHKNRYTTLKTRFYFFQWKTVSIILFSAPTQVINN